MSSTLKDFQQWERVQEKADELKYNLEQNIRLIWTEYVFLHLNSQGDRFPDDVDTMSIFNDILHISGHSYCRGHTDYDSCRISVDFVFGEAEDRQRLIENKKLAEEHAQLEQKRIKEEKEKEEFERLKKKYG